MEYAELKTKVEAAFADRSLLSDSAVKQAVLDTIALLDQGKLRVATCDEPGKWTGNGITDPNDANYKDQLWDTL